MPTAEANVLANELERTNPTVAVLFERESTFYSKAIEKRPAEKVSARDMRVPLEIRSGGRFGMYNPDGGDLARGTGLKFEKGTLPVVYTRMGVEWTRKSDIATDDAKKAVLSTFRRLVATSMAEKRRHIDSLCMTGGDGVVGTVTAVSTASNKDTLTLGGGATGDGFDIRLLRDGQYVSVYNSALTTRRTHTLNASVNGYAPIDLYDINNKQVRVSGTTGATVAGDKVVIEGTTATPPVSILGVRYHHSDASTGTWLGLDRATFPIVRASRINANSAGFALPFARRAVNRLGNRVGIDKMMSLQAWMHPCQKQAYEESGQLVSVIQKSAKDEALNMYFGDKMQMAGAPVETSFSWDKTRIDFIAKEVWGRSEIHPVQYYTDKGGRKFFEARSTDGGVATADLFYIVSAMNTYVNNPAACVYISDLAVPTGY